LSDAQFSAVANPSFIAFGRPSAAAAAPGPHLRRRPGFDRVRVCRLNDARTATLSPASDVNHSETHFGPLWVKLASAGVRPTRQRLELADILFGKGERHFTAEMIHGEARALRYPPSLGTIYNTLNHFVETGLLREIALYDSKLWYDTNTGPHCHYYWEDTDEISDIPAEHVPNLQVPAPAGAKVTAIDVIVRVRAESAERECPLAKFERFLK
jgi:Fur family transcriptional regulator, iron response regulator